MNFKLQISEAFKARETEIESFIKGFSENGEALDAKARNTIKIFELNGIKLNIKGFRTPNTVNKVAYRFFRKSKAERSFLYAHYLLKRGIGTPKPIAFAEETTTFRFMKSYYVSEHLNYDLTFRELDLQKENHAEILKAFTRFTYKLHENDIEFLDHSPGNTLIQLNNGDYKFFLVDLNRMNFRKLRFEERMKNFARLTKEKKKVKIMASEYAKLSGHPETEVFEKMWFYIRQFQEKFMRKHRLKQKLGLRK